MIVTVKTSRDVMKTFALDITAGSFLTDQALLDAINLAVRTQMWEGFTNYDKIYYPNGFDSLKAPPIVMIFNASHCDQ